MWNTPSRSPIHLFFLDLGRAIKCYHLFRLGILSESIGTGATLCGGACLAPGYPVDGEWRPACFGDPMLSGSGSLGVVTEKS